MISERALLPGWERLKNPADKAGKHETRSFLFLLSSTRVVCPYAYQTRTGKNSRKGTRCLGKNIFSPTSCLGTSEIHTDDLPVTLLP